MEAIGLFATGVLVGYVAWLRADFLVGVLILPFVANYATRRWSTFAMTFGYFGAGNIELPDIVGRFFAHPNPLVQFVAPLALTALLAAPFLIYAAGARPWVRILTWFAALLVLSVPPVGLFAWHNPLFLAGSLYPHAGLLGIVLTALLLATMAGLRGRVGPRAGLLAALMAASGFYAVHYAHFAMGTPAVNWGAVPTNAPPASTPHAQTERTAAAIRIMHEAIPLSGFSAFVFPESTIEPYRPVDELMLFEPSNLAAKHHEALVFGAVIEDGHGGWRDVVMGAGTMANQDGTPRILTDARVPMPVGNWHLGLPGGAPLHAFSTDRGTIGNSPVAWSICYEDTILWPHWFLLTGNPAALVALDDDWVLSGTRAARAQAISAHQLARMAGVLLVDAVND
ncbi:MAG: hypothetical protein EPN36_03380 [Rhodanobacteraceae bacterium]|nr:MAG: hypothetical protein EPN36_03380 [Rhodanobacteraceae bacterium]